MRRTRGQEERNPFSLINEKIMYLTLFLLIHQTPRKSKSERWIMMGDRLRTTASGIGQIKHRASSSDGESRGGKPHQWRYVPTLETSDTREAEEGRDTDDERRRGVRTKQYE